MTTESHPIPNWTASPADFTHDCGEVYRITGDTEAKRAAALDAWTCPCVPKPTLFEPDANPFALAAVFAAAVIVLAALVGCAVWLGVATR